MPPGNRPRSQDRLSVPGLPEGFTTIELVVVIVILAVLAAAAVPRLAGRSAFDARGFADEVASAVRFAQRSAVALRRPVTLQVDAPAPGQPCALRLCIAADCSTQVVDPASGQNFCLQAPPPLALTLTTSPVAGTPASFDSRGRPAAGFVFSIAGTIAGLDDIARSVTVEAETGHVR